ncbi:unnamed protein product [Prorocentrum cordatum]|uniref:Phosphatase PP2A regulatory subunit A/Splicing factor 3B subunit 1-like HEAT repeat domain-containing protein n=1 Tax=Prorocentrum cordatum TaxID=2364126 RepID=A0ABN9PS23_9DINO|nr:unnamed protein product [Polarella glacialis]
MNLESDPQVQRHVCSLISRLAGSHDWFTSRMSACGLFSVALPKVSGSKQDDLLKAYTRLCSDDTPMVRRQAASVLGEVASVLPQESMLPELVEAFEKLCKDEQESVRILAIANCVALGRLQPSAERQAQIFPVVESCAQDKSWRVRYVMAEHVHTLCEVFQAKAEAHIVPLYLQLLQDQEVEVRTMAAARIAGVSKVKPDKELLEMLIPVMEKLTAPRERSQHVRAALAGAVLSLAPIFGPDLTVDHLVNIFLHLIKDESADVRLKLIGTLGELSSAMDIDVLSQSLLPCIKELGRDRQWRVRRMVIDSMPSLAKHLGPTKFTEELSGLFAAWLEDPVFSVRDAIAVNFRLLYVELGTSWCETHVVPRLQALLAHGNYLYRISAVLCAGRLAEVAAREFLDKHLVPLVVKLAADPVPNVCFNTAKVIQAMQPFAAKTSPTVTESHLIPCLRRQAADADPDVKFYARRALTEMGVSCEEIDAHFGEVLTAQRHEVVAQTCQGLLQAGVGCSDPVSKTISGCWRPGFCSELVAERCPAACAGERLCRDTRTAGLLTYDKFTAAFAKAMVYMLMEELSKVELMKLMFLTAAKFVASLLLIQAAVCWADWPRSNRLVTLAWLVTFGAPFMRSLLPTPVLIHWAPIDQQFTEFLKVTNQHYNISGRMDTLSKVAGISCNDHAMEDKVDSTWSSVHQNTLWWCGKVTSASRWFPWSETLKKGAEECQVVTNEVGIGDDATQLVGANKQRLCRLINSTQVEDVRDNPLSSMREIVDVPWVRNAARGLVGTTSSILSFRALMPLALSIAPGLLEAAIRIKVMIPESYLPGVFIVIMPLLYVPLIWSFSAFVVQSLGDPCLLAGIALLAFSPLAYTALAIGMRVTSPMSRRGAQTFADRVWWFMGKLVPHAGKICKCGLRQ